MECTVREDPHDETKLYAVSKPETNSLEKDLNTINSLKSRNDTVIFRNDSETECQVKFKGLNDLDSICFDDDSLPPIPDGGWGWVVVFSSFIVSMCADGLAYSFGLLQEEFTSYFESTQSKTSLVGSLFIATPLIAGPIMSALVNRYGCRVMTMIAGIISTLGFLLASLSDSIEMLCLTFGFLTGLGMGILYVTAVVSVAFWFEKKRNFAVSLASCGLGFGTVIYSPMTSYWLRTYAWRNTLILLAGTLLQICICGALMRDPDWLIIKQNRQRLLSKSRSRKSSVLSVSSKSIGGESLFMSAEELKALLKSGQSPEYILATIATSIAEANTLEATTQMNSQSLYKRMHSAVNLPTYLQQTEEVPTEVIDKLMSNKRLYNIILQNYPDLLKRRHSDENLHGSNLNTDAINEPATLAMIVKVKRTKRQSESERNRSEAKLNVIEGGKPIDRVADVSMRNSQNGSKMSETKSNKTNMSTSREAKNVLKKGRTGNHYLEEIPLFKNTIIPRGAMFNIPMRYQLRATSLPNIKRNSLWSLSTVSEDETWHERCWQPIKRTFDFRIFTEFHFLMLNISAVVLSAWFIVPYFYLNSYMNSLNIEGGPTMIGIIGISSSIGIVTLGWAGDQPWINVTKAYTVCLLLCGLSVGAYPFFITNFWVVAVLSSVFGFTFASSYSYTPAILMELMPMDHFTVSYGMILLSQGIGHLGGPPLAGMLFDITGTWDLTFYMAGIWLVISGICLGAVCYTNDFRLCGTEPLLKDTEMSNKTSQSEKKNSELHA